MQTEHYAQQKPDENMGQSIAHSRELIFNSRREKHLHCHHLCCCGIKPHRTTIKCVILNEAILMNVGILNEVHIDGYLYPKDNKL